MVVCYVKVTSGRMKSCLVSLSVVVKDVPIRELTIQPTGLFLNAKKCLENLTKKKKRNCIFKEI